LRRVVTFVDLCCVVLVALVAYLGFQSNTVESRIIACEHLVRTDARDVILMTGRSVLASKADATEHSHLRNQGFVLAATLVVLGLIRIGLTMRIRRGSG
jgi:hypothetical protein